MELELLGKTEPLHKIVGSAEDGHTSPAGDILTIIDALHRLLGGLEPIVSAGAAVVVAIFMIRGTRAMQRANDQRAEAERNRAEAEKNRHKESMTALSEIIRRTPPSQDGSQPDRG